MNHSRSNSNATSGGIISQSRYGASSDNDRNGIEESKGKNDRSSRSRNKNEEHDQFIIDSDNSDSEGDESDLHRSSTPPSPLTSILPNNISSRNNSTTTSNSYPPPTSNSNSNTNSITNTPTKKTKKKSLSITSSTSSSSNSGLGNNSTPSSSLVVDSLSSGPVGGSGEVGGSEFSQWENSPNAVLKGEKIGLRGL